VGEAVDVYAAMSGAEVFSRRLEINILDLALNQVAAGLAQQTTVLAGLAFADEQYDRIPAQPNAVAAAHTFGTVADDLAQLVADRHADFTHQNHRLLQTAPADLPLSGSAVH